MFGLRFPLWYLELIPYLVYYGRLDQKALYVDVVTWHFTKDSNWIESQDKNHPPDLVIPMQTTNIGNAAYIALYASEERHRAFAKKLIPGQNVVAIWILDLIHWIFGITESYPPHDTGFLNNVVLPNQERFFKRSNEDKKK